MPGRRSVLSSLGGGAALLSGCSSSLTTGPDPAERVADWQEEPARGAADSVAFERSVDETGRLESRCRSVSREQTSALLDDTDSVSVSLTTPSGTERLGVGDEGRVLVVTRYVLVSRTGAVRSTPTVAFDTVREATTRTVRGTIARDGDERTCRVPVYVRDGLVQEG